MDDGPNLASVCSFWWYDSLLFRNMGACGWGNSPFHHAKTPMLFPKRFFSHEMKIMEGAFVAMNLAKEEHVKGDICIRQGGFGAMQGLIHNTPPTR